MGESSGSGTGFSSAGEAIDLLNEMLSAADQLIHGAYPKLLDDEIFQVGRLSESLSRKLWASQVRLTDEVDQRGMAAARSCSSTQSLLRQAFNISPTEAGLRVRAARATQPHTLPAGGETPAVLPLLAAAIDGGLVDREHVRSCVDTMEALPKSLEAADRDDVEQALLGYAVELEPIQFRKVARHLEEVMIPRGNPDEREPASRIEFNIGLRSSATGLTSINGRLDDLSTEILRKAIDGLSAPKPDIDGLKDLRPVAMRRAHALIEALNFTLTQAGVPEQAGERPQVTVTLNWDLLSNRIGPAILDNGGTLSPATTRRLLCDAKVIPAVLGGEGEVLDLGRSSRTFSRATRRAIALRDRGCTFPGCDRPPAWCDCHHVKYWIRDFGDTSYSNGCLLCQFHHSVIHQGEWRIVFATDGVPEFIPPTWIDETQRPRRNTLHSLAPDDSG